MKSLCVARKAGRCNGQAAVVAARLVAHCWAALQWAGKQVWPVEAEAAYSRRPWSSSLEGRLKQASQGYQKCQNKGRFVNNKRWQPKQPDVPIEQDHSCLYPIIMWGLCTMSCYLGSASFKSQAWIVTRGGKSWAPLTPHPAALWPMAARGAAVAATTVAAAAAAAACDGNRNSRSQKPPLPHAHRIIL